MHNSIIWEHSKNKCGSIVDICSLASDGGECEAYIPSWYYDKERRRCLQFVYGGCGGNANRFQTVEECEGRCAAQNPDPRLQVTGLGMPSHGSCVMGI